jgi:methionyl-tRNA synthetase
MTEVVFGRDGDFSHKNMVLKVNSNLANELGNLCQRILSMVYKNCGEAVPSTIGAYTEADEALLRKARDLHKQVSEALSQQAIQRYCEIMVSMVWDTNKYVDEMAPWNLRKTDSDRMATVLYVVMEVLRHVAILYQPVIPTAASRILDQLSVPQHERTFAHLDDAQATIRPGAAISKPEAVFPRLEVPTEELVNTK